MADTDYNVYQSADGKWRGKKQGATRASVVGDTQKEVFDATRALAKNAGAEVAIHRGDNGQIRAKHSYGNDPSDISG